MVFEGIGAPILPHSRARASLRFLASLGDRLTWRSVHLAIGSLGDPLASRAPIRLAQRRSISRSAKLDGRVKLMSTATLRKTNRKSPIVTSQKGKPLPAKAKIAKANDAKVHDGDRPRPFPIEQHIIGGRMRPSVSGETIPVIAPGDGNVFAEIASGAAADISRAVAAARAAFEGAWGRLTATGRGRLLLK